jgi:hypothetical protein
VEQLAISQYYFFNHAVIEMLQIIGTLSYALACFKILLRLFSFKPEHKFVSSLSQLTLRLFSDYERRKIQELDLEKFIRPV